MENGRAATGTGEGYAAVLAGGLEMPGALFSSRQMREDGVHTTPSFPAAQRCCAEPAQHVPGHAYGHSDGHFFKVT